jgi:hypothetical protein
MVKDGIELQDTLVLRHTSIGELGGWGKAKRAPAAIDWGFATLSHQPPDS